MPHVHIARREEHVVASYKVILLFDEEDRVVGAVVEGPRMTRPIYLGVNEEVRVKLSKQVKKFLEKYGFKIK